MEIVYLYNMIEAFAKKKIINDVQQWVNCKVGPAVYLSIYKIFHLHYWTIRRNDNVDDTDT